MVTKLLTTVRDREILDGEVATFRDQAGSTADRYLIDGAINGDVTVDDFDGGVIVIKAGTAIESVQIADGTLVFIVNGSTVTFTLGAAAATYSIVLGGSNEAPELGTLYSTEEFATLVGAVDGGPAVTDVGTVNADGTLGDGSVDPGPTPSGLALTVGQDNLTGTAGDDVFSASLAQNPLGAATNTFESGDVLNGGGGRNKLEADVTAVVSGAVPVGPAISATTTGIQEVYLRHQFPVLDAINGNNVGLATIDAEKMSGVEQWWSSNSRNTIVIEDVRSDSADTTFGFRNSDPSQITSGNNPNSLAQILSTDFEAYFSPDALLGLNEEVDSTLTYTVFENGNLAAELDNVSIFQLRFILDGVAYAVSSEAIEAADTYQELADAVNVELAAQGLTSVTAAPVAGQPRITLTDANAGTFQSAGENSIILSFGEATVTQNAQVGEPEILEELIKTNIVLDNVGRTSEGGSMIVGSMSTRGGIEQFDVTVQRSSWLQSLDSTNNTLEEVYVESAMGATNYLRIGTGTESNPGLNSQQRVPTTTDNRLTTTGLTDVRVFDATAFAGELKLGARLTEDIFDKYLSDAEDTIEFQYLFGDNNTNFSLNLDEQIARDSDFALSIVGGDGDDRFNLSGNATKSSTSIDGGAGFNVVEVTTTTNSSVTVPSTGANQAFDEFVNVDRLVVAGMNNTTQNIVTGNMDGAGLSSIVIATNNGNNTTIQQMRMDTELTISGKNFTVGPNNNNMDQDFGVISIQGTRALPPGDTELEIKIENTARFDGVLTIDALAVVDQNSANTSGVRSVVLESAGVRDTLNRVSDFSAVRTADLTLVGSQALGINVTALGATPGAPGFLDTLIDASDLGGRVTLAVNANGVLNNGDDDVLTGTTAGMADLLNIYGSGADLDTTVTGFEAIQFGWLGGPNRTTIDTNAGAQAFEGGVYDAVNTLGINEFIVGNLGAGASFGLEGLRDGNLVTLGDATGPNGQVLAVAAQNISLQGPDSGAAVINIAALSQLNAANYAPGAITAFNVNGFGTVNASIARPGDAAAAVVNYDIPAVLDAVDPANSLVEDGVTPGISFDGSVPTGGYISQVAGNNEALYVENITQNFVLTGGATTASLANSGLNVLDFSELLPASLNLIDVSGFNGHVSFTLENAVQESAVAGIQTRANDDVRVVVQSLYNLDVTLTAPVVVGNDFSSVDFNTRFEFTGAPATQIGGMPAATWTIDNFVVGQPDGLGVLDPIGVNVDNHTILDVRALGISSYAELDVLQVANNTVITSEAQGLNPTWAIVLTNVDVNDLGVAENFIFA